jgi:sugar/nucleoside kinase (ribokinase family)
MIDVLGIGESSIDYVYRVPALPHHGGPAKVRIARASVSPGGQVATTLATCASLGLSTHYMGALGNDENGRLVREALRRRGVQIDACITREGASRYAVILVDDRTGDRVVLWHRDDAVMLRPSDVRTEHLRNIRLLHVDAVDEGVAIHAATLARELGIPVTVDVDHVSARTRELVEAVTIPILGEGVPEALTGEVDAARALRQLAAGHPLACVTLGPRGAMLVAGDELHVAEGHRVRAVDTTGAGDVVRGAFIDAFLRNEPPERILRWANAAAAVSCAREGALASVPKREEIERGGGG